MKRLDRDFWVFVVLAAGWFGSGILRDSMAGAGTLEVAGKKIPFGDSARVAKELVASASGEVVVNLNLATPPGAIIVSTYASGLRVGIPSDQIARFHEFNSNYRQIRLKNGDLIPVSDTVDQIRIKLQNVGWVVK